MTPEEREEIRKHVRKELDQQKKSISTLTELLDSEVQSDANDWFSSKESNPSKDINEMALAKARHRMLILNEVINRIESSDFGICVICGKPIAFERMKAVPTATRCVSCQ